MALSFPLDSTATGQADDVFYCFHAGDDDSGTYDNDLFTTSKGRIPLKRGDPRCGHWCDLYEQILAHNTDGSQEFPECGKGHDHHPQDCPHCKAPETDDETEENPTGPPKDDTEDDPVTPVQPCPEEGFKLVEFIEVVARDVEHWVTGPLLAAVDHTYAKKPISRTDKNTGDFKQFINLPQDPEGQPKRHPEYGRVILVRARIEQLDGAKGKLGGQAVNFELVRTDGPNRTDGTVWDAGDLTGDQREGIEARDRTYKFTKTVDGTGWTDPVQINLSQYAGDKFDLTATLDPGVEGAAKSPMFQTVAPYIVWRKFWFQLTHATGFAVPNPSSALTAYKKIFADMIQANKRTFAKADLPIDLQNRTFQPAYMFKANGGNGIVANIGEGNYKEFYKNAVSKLIKPANEPLKDIAIIAEYQIDPAGATPLTPFVMTSRTQTFTLPGSASGGYIISKPPVAASQPLVVAGNWYDIDPATAPLVPKGSLVDADVTITPTRLSLQDVTVTLPAAVPEPTVLAPIWIELSVNIGDDFLGWAPNPEGGVVACYDPAAKAGDSKSEVDYNDTVAHEFAHQFNQTPRPTNVQPSLKAHPWQHLGHGGSGSHCRYGAVVAPGPVNWQDPNEDTPEPDEGECLEYFRYSSDCDHVFCPVCQIHMQLEKLDKFG